MICELAFVIQTVELARREGAEKKKGTTKTPKTSEGQALLPPLHGRPLASILASGPPLASGEDFFEVLEVFVVRF
jgi:hypothetical protein